jgi:hypothetical protein
MLLSQLFAPLQFFARRYSELSVEASLLPPAPAHPLATQKNQQRKERQRRTQDIWSLIDSPRPFIFHFDHIRGSFLGGLFSSPFVLAIDDKDQRADRLGDEAAHCEQRALRLAAALEWTHPCLSAK